MRSLAACPGLTALTLLLATCTACSSDGPSGGGPGNAGGGKGSGIGGSAGSASSGGAAGSAAGPNNAGTGTSGDGGGGGGPADGSGSGAGGGAGGAIGGAGGAGAGGTPTGGASALPVLTEVFGFATQYTDPVTSTKFSPDGGAAAPASNVYVVKNRKELKAALANANSPSYATNAAAALLEPKLIYVVGTIHGDELEQGGSADAAYYRTTPNPNHYDFATYLKFFDTAYKADLTTKANGGDAAAQAELALINEQPAGARTTFSNNQKSQIQFQVPPNTSLLGVGSDAKLVDGYLSLNTYSPSFGKTLRSNIVIRNLEFQAPQDLAPAWDPSDTATGAWNARYDAVSIVTSRAIWIDHCTFSDGLHEDSAEPTPFSGKHVQRHDGLLDIEDGADAITISYSIFRRHDKTMLIGSTDGGDQGQENYEKGHERITLFANLWEDSTQRAPLGRWGSFHVVNNLYRGNPTAAAYPLSYFIGAGTQASILSEANTFVPVTVTAATLQARLVKNSGGSEFHDAGSWLDGQPFAGLDALAGGVHTLTWSPPYAYPKAQNAADLANYVQANAGAGKLDIKAP
jgi:pectate lyase